MFMLVSSMSRLPKFSPWKTRWGWKVGVVFSSLPFCGGIALWVVRPRDRRAGGFPDGQKRNV